MRTRASFLRVTLGSLVALAIGMAAPPARAEEKGGGTDQPLAALPREPPAPKDNPTTPGKVALGKQLFFDPRLSGDNKMSCASCHLPGKAFGDGKPLAPGRGGKVLTRNALSLLDAGFYSTFTWDGRKKTLEEQALNPIESPDEMGQGLAELEKELNEVPGYVRQFQAIFGTNVTRDGVARAFRRSNER